MQGFSPTFPLILHESILYVKAAKIFCNFTKKGLAFFHQNCAKYFCTFVERQINKIVYKTDIEGSFLGKSKTMNVSTQFLLYVEFEKWLKMGLFKGSKT